MKANLLYGAAIWTFLSAAAFFSGCSDDDAYKDVHFESEFDPFSPLSPHPQASSAVNSA